MRYSFITGGFYDQAVHGENIPLDAKDVSDELYSALFQGQSQGKVISADLNGNPVLITPEGPTLEESITALVKQIDADADAIYTAALGNRATEYAEAESQAQAFKDAAYAGDVPTYVQAWATATGNTAKWSADDILATAAAWRIAQAAIRAQRLACKEAARKAEDAATLAAVATQWSAFVTAIKAQLSL